MSGLPKFRTPSGDCHYIDLAEVAAAHGRAISELPFAARVLLENLARHHHLGSAVEAGDVATMANWQANIGKGIPLHVGRVILPDSSGLPVLQDLAALRDAVAKAGSDARTVEPRVQVDVIVDHSLQVDHSAQADAMALNMQREFERNSERYRFLKWAQQAFASLGVYPPGSGIIHQINLEKIASVISGQALDDGLLAYPDFVIGGDSHTPMVNSLGVLGWGVGGIDALAAMLGGAYVFPVPEIVGVRLSGALPVGATTTDLVLLITQRLRAENVTAAIVEYFGKGAASLSVPERATIANMAPEYGATGGFFAIDEETIRYLERTRSPEHAAFVRAYATANSLFRDAAATDPSYSRVIDIDISNVRRSVAGPRRPQDRLELPEVAADFRHKLPQPLAEGGFAVEPASVAIETSAGSRDIGHGALAIAAITACTNTSNPAVMMAAGLLARNAIAAGLTVPSYVKTSLAPGSRVVTRYLEEAGLLSSLGQLGFSLIGYGCTTCGGKSGPLLPAMAKAIDDGKLVAAAALSGNRNFEGRIHRQVRANYIMSPPLVVAFALAGRIDIDLENEPLGHGPDGAPIHLADIWPSADDVATLVAKAASPELFREAYGQRSNQLWDSLEAPAGDQYAWDPNSTYLVEPPFFAMAAEAAARGIPDRISNARALGAYGDSLTTDHISPGGEIPVDSAAGRYLIGLGIEPRAFNTYVGRRCNHEVMARATFANLRIKNLMVPEREGGFTRLLPEGELTGVHEAATAYGERGTALIVLGGREYGTGSSRDWAAKGSALLGVSAVIAESYERIHRANLVSMGVVPLRFAEGEGWRQLGLDGSEEFTLSGIQAAIETGAVVTVEARAANGLKTFSATVEISTRSERDCLVSGGLLAQVSASFQTKTKAPGEGPETEHP